MIAENTTELITRCVREARLDPKTAFAYQAQLADIDLRLAGMAEPVVVGVKPNAVTLFRANGDGSTLAFLRLPHINPDLFGAHVRRLAAHHNLALINEALS